MGYGAFYVICPRASSQYVTPLNPPVLNAPGAVTPSEFRQDVSTVKTRMIGTIIC